MDNPEDFEILIVDDQKTNRDVLNELLIHWKYRTRRAADGEEALAEVARRQPDLILLDVKMPGMDGYEVTRRLRANADTKHIPVVLVTSLNDREARLRGLDAGAEDFLTKPVDSSELKARVRNLLRLKEYSDFLSNHNAILAHQVEIRTAELNRGFRETIMTLIKVSTYKDEETGAHVKRISYYASELARQLGMDGAFSDAIFYASPMHDVGKIGVPDAILQKPGPFTAEEWSIIKSHSAFGAAMLEDSASPYLVMGREIALNHHERWNGGGYPNGLEGEAIPLSARIMNICDQYDALRSERRYKRAFDHATAVDIITKGDGRTMPEHFDPNVLEAFKVTTAKFDEIYGAFREDS
ncbi:MAG: response regulator [Betaproteobacteria bacterium]|nr:response regulator [Betaproteobacteria bacterium]